METKTSWTPGPWKAEFEAEEEFEGEGLDPSYGRLTVESESGTVALVGPLGPVKDDEDRANARLIAAAPDMAALLELAVELDDVADSDYDACMALEKIGKAARALLAKIKGEQDA